MIFSAGAILSLGAVVWLTSLGGCSGSGCIRNSDCPDGFKCVAGGCLFRPEDGGISFNDAGIHLDAAADMKTVIDVAKPTNDLNSGDGQAKDASSLIDGQLKDTLQIDSISKE